MTAVEHLQVVRPPRTEVEVAADTVAAILALGIVKRNAENIARMSRAAGVSPFEVRDGWRRLQDGKFREPSRLPAAPAPTDAPDLAEPAVVRRLSDARQLAGGRHGAQVSTARRIGFKNPEPGVRICKTCGPQPAANFRKKGRNTKGEQVWDYLCSDCRRAYQRERYVRVGHRSVRIELLAGDEAVGDHCADCGLEFTPGDVIVTGDMRHDLCPS